MKDKVIKLIATGRGLSYFVRQEEKWLEKMPSSLEADELVCKEIQESHLDRNEYLSMEQSKPPFEPLSVHNTEDESSEETEEEFDWYEPDKHEKESYFVLTNLQRRTLQPGEQAFYCYGNRSNKFLLKNYGFCYLGNRYDSYVVKLKMNVNYS